MEKYPTGTNAVVKLKKLYTITEKIQNAELASTRMVKCAAMLSNDSFIGWQMFLPTKGLANISFFGGKNVTCSDLDWITENCATTCHTSSSENEPTNELTSLYSLSLDIHEVKNHNTVGFCSETPKYNCSLDCFWPINYSNQFPEIVRVLRESGAKIRFIIAKASSSEILECRQSFVQTWNHPTINKEAYFGKPVKLSILLKLPSEPTIRVKSIFDEAIPGLKFTFLGNTSNSKCKKIWEDPLIVGKVYPEFAAKIMMLEPILFHSDSILGIESCEKETKPMPAKHDNPNSKNALTIGKALFSSGETRKVRIDDDSLKMHWDLVGMSGTGKSSLLVQTVLSAVETNHSCTVLDPHGSLVNMIIRCIPQKYSSRIKVIRIGDGDKNPVPIRIHKTDDYEKEEIQINNLCSMFQEIFDPNKQGFVGPRWVRLYSLLCKCSLALGLGGTFQSILTLVQTKDNMKRALDALARSKNEKYRDIYDGIRTELVNNRSSDYEEVIGWFISKFQSLISIPQLRNIFGVSGEANALNFSDLIDSNKVLLIDLSSPTIGANAAKVAGTLLVNQLWDSILTRKHPEHNHILIIDEAHLFSGGGSRLDRIIYEGRKFGVSLIMAHQNCSQLSSDIREAIASTANFSSFRLSVKDANEAAIRFDNALFRTKLCRLGNYNAVTSISVNGSQCEPFTLQIVKPKVQKDCEAVAKEIESKSIEELVAPFRKFKPMSSSDILAAIINYGRSDVNEEIEASEECLNDELIVCPEDDDVFLPKDDKGKLSKQGNKTGSKILDNSAA